jgi:hypothetical protein
LSLSIHGRGEPCRASSEAVRSFAVDAEQSRKSLILTTSEYLARLDVESGDERRSLCNANNLQLSVLMNNAELSMLGSIFYLGWLRFAVNVLAPL